MSEVEELTREFESEHGQEALMREAASLFASAKRSIPVDELVKLDNAYALSRSGRGGIVKDAARDDYEELLRSVLVEYVVPLCFGEKWSYRGVYDPLTAARVILGRECAISENDALEALSSAQIESPDLAGKPAGEGSFDPLDPATWIWSGVVLQAVSPDGDALSWASRMRDVYALQLCEKVLAES